MSAKTQLKQILMSQVGKASLASKWMPRKGPVANDLRKYLNYDPKTYRKMLVELTKVVETQMCAKQWNEITYDHVPSVAANRYQKAFNKHDATRYAGWKQGLKDGTSKVNASVLYPYSVLKSIQYGDRDVSLAQWEALPNYLNQDCRVLPMVDVSGSMTCQVGGQKGVGLTCMEVATSLGLYIADKQQGAFKDTWLTFTRDSHIDVLKGNILQKLNQMTRAVGYDTNLESAFQAILQVGVSNNLPQEEMPQILIVFTDLEFNPAFIGGKSVGAFELANRMYEQAGYKMPRIVWWNLNARADGRGNVPVRFDENGTACVSGFSPSLMKSILSGKDFTPRSIMLETVQSDRYSPVRA